MQFVKTALSSVWTHERRGGPLYVNTGLKKKKRLAQSLQLIDTLHLSSCSRGLLAGSAELPKTHNFTSANTVFIHLTSKTRPHVSNLCVLMSPSSFFFSVIPIMHIFLYLMIFYWPLRFCSFLFFVLFLRLDNLISSIQVHGYFFFSFLLAYAAKSCL